MRINPTVGTARPYNGSTSEILKSVLKQNINAGVAIREVDKIIDAPSGPKTNLPPQTNF